MSEINIAKEFIESETKINLRMLTDVEINREEKINYIIGIKAWSDAFAYIRYNSSEYSKFIDKQEDIVEYISSRLSSINSNNDYEAWHRETMDGLKDISSLFTYGLAQKLLNMSIKYFYFLEIGYKCNLFGENTFSDMQQDLDIPIDRFILYWTLYNSINDDEIIQIANSITPWNKMDDFWVYKILQKRIKSILREKYSSISSVLISETLVWSNIRSIPLLKK